MKSNFGRCLFRGITCGTLWFSKVMFMKYAGLLMSAPTVARVLKGPVFQPEMKMAFLYSAQGMPLVFALFCSALQTHCTTGSSRHSRHKCCLKRLGFIYLTDQECHEPSFGRLKQRNDPTDRRDTFSV